MGFFCIFKIVICCNFVICNTCDIMCNAFAFVVHEVDFDMAET